MTKELGFIEGQLQAHGISARTASRIARFATLGQWDAAFRCIHDNPTATRILQRIQEMRQGHGQ